MYVDRPVPADFVTMFEGRAHVVGPEPEALASADGALAGSSLWSGDRMDTGPRLRVISRTGIGYDAVDLDEATLRGIVVCNAPEAPTISTAEHTMALLLHAAKSLTKNQQRLRDQADNYYAANEAIELAGKTLGVVGHGRIGSRVTAAARALGMRTIAHDPYLSEWPADVESIELEQLLSQADVVSAHCPLTPETALMFDAAAFASMRKGVVFVNAARGGLVDQHALVAALDSGHVASAGLDVTTPEPLPADHPLQGRDNVLITPHIASATDVGRRKMYSDAIDNALALLSGDPVTTCVNGGVFDTESFANRQGR